MGHTFLCTLDNGEENIAVKFTSPSRVTSEFLVTFLTAPDCEPFLMKYEEGRWHFPRQLPVEMQAMESKLLDAARRFERRVLS